MKTGVADLENKEGILTSSDKEKAEVLNRFYSSVFTQENTDNILALRRPHCEEELTDLQITPQNVEGKLKKLRIGKSPGPDGLHPRVFQAAAIVLSIPPCTLYKRSLAEGTLPSEWKVSQISLIFKKGERHSPGNYRPVCLTAIVYKVMESLLRDAIMEHLNSNGLLSDNQHGFVPGRSCDSAARDTRDLDYNH